jgi:hypothetical protein
VLPLHRLHINLVEQQMKNRNVISIVGKIIQPTWGQKKKNQKSKLYIALASFRYSGLEDFHPPTISKNKTK